MPCRWREGGLGDFAGHVRFTRQFSWPGRLDAFERVWLTFGGASGFVEVALNGQQLGHHQGTKPWEIEVTSLLQPRNKLVVDVESRDSNGGLWGEVALEVRCTAFLQDVQAWLVHQKDHADLHVVGQVVGTCERALDLYVRWKNMTMVWTTVEADQTGKPFHARSAPLLLSEAKPGPVQVELINGGVIWYVVELQAEIGDQHILPR